MSWAQEWVFATGMEITWSALATRLETRVVPRLVGEGTSIQAGESASREVNRPGFIGDRFARDFVSRTLDQSSGGLDRSLGG